MRTFGRSKQQHKSDVLAVSTGASESMHASSNEAGVENDTNSGSEGAGEVAEPVCGSLSTRARANSGIGRREKESRQTIALSRLNMREAVRLGVEKDVQLLYNQMEIIRNSQQNKNFSFILNLPSSSVAWSDDELIRLRGWLERLGFSLDNSDSSYDRFLLKMGQAEDLWRILRASCMNSDASSTATAFRRVDSPPGNKRKIQVILGGPMLGPDGRRRSLSMTAAHTPKSVSTQDAGSRSISLTDGDAAVSSAIDAPSASVFGSSVFTRQRKGAQLRFPQASMKSVAEQGSHSGLSLQEPVHSRSEAEIRTAARHVHLHAPLRQRTLSDESSDFDMESPFIMCGSGGQSSGSSRDNYSPVVNNLTTNNQPGVHGSNSNGSTSGRSRSNPSPFEIMLANSVRETLVIDKENDHEGSNVCLPARAVKSPRLGLHDSAGRKGSTGSRSDLQKSVGSVSVSSSAGGGLIHRIAEEEEGDTIDMANRSFSPTERADGSGLEHSACDSDSSTILDSSLEDIDAYAMSTCADVRQSSDLQVDMAAGPAAVEGCGVLNEKGVSIGDVQGSSATECRTIVQQTMPEFLLRPRASGASVWSPSVKSCIRKDLAPTKERSAISAEVEVREPTSWTQQDTYFRAVAAPVDHADSAAVVDGDVIFSGEEENALDALAGVDALRLSALSSASAVPGRNSAGTGASPSSAVPTTNLPPRQVGPSGSSNQTSSPEFYQAFRKPAPSVVGVRPVAEAFPLNTRFSENSDVPTISASIRRAVSMPIVASSHSSHSLLDAAATPAPQVSLSQNNADYYCTPVGVCPGLKWELSEGAEEQVIARMRRRFAVALSSTPLSAQHATTSSASARARAAAMSAGAGACSESSSHVAHGSIFNRPMPQSGGNSNSFGPVVGSASVAIVDTFGRSEIWGSSRADTNTAVGSGSDPHEQDLFVFPKDSAGHLRPSSGGTHVRFGNAEYADPDSQPRSYPARAVGPADPLAAMSEAQQGSGQWQSSPLQLMGGPSPPSMGSIMGSGGLRRSKSTSCLELSSPIVGCPPVSALGTLGTPAGIISTGSSPLRAEADDGGRLGLGAMSIDGPVQAERGMEGPAERGDVSSEHVDLLSAPTPLYSRVSVPLRRLSGFHDAGLFALPDNGSGGWKANGVNVPSAVDAALQNCRAHVQNRLIGPHASSSAVAAAAAAGRDPDQQRSSVLIAGPIVGGADVHASRKDVLTRAKLRRRSVVTASHLPSSSRSSVGPALDLVSTRMRGCGETTEAKAGVGAGLWAGAGMMDVLQEPANAADCETNDSPSVSRHDFYSALSSALSPSPKAKAGAHRRVARRSSVSLLQPALPMLPRVSFSSSGESRALGFTAGNAGMALTRLSEGGGVESESFNGQIVGAVFQHCFDGQMPVVASKSWEDTRVIDVHLNTVSDRPALLPELTLLVRIPRQQTRSVALSFGSAWSVIRTSPAGWLVHSTAASSVSYSPKKLFFFLEKHPFDWITTDCCSVDSSARTHFSALRSRPAGCALTHAGFRSIAILDSSSKSAAIEVCADETNRSTIRLNDRRVDSDGAEDGGACSDAESVSTRSTEGYESSSCGSLADEAHVKIAAFDGRTRSADSDRTGSRCTTKPCGDSRSNSRSNSRETDSTRNIFTQLEQVYDDAPRNGHGHGVSEIHVNSARVFKLLQRSAPPDWTHASLLVRVIPFLVAEENLVQAVALAQQLGGRVGSNAGGGLVRARSRRAHGSLNAAAALMTLSLVSKSWALGVSMVTARCKSDFLVNKSSALQLDQHRNFVASCQNVRYLNDGVCKRVYKVQRGQGIQEAVSVMDIRDLVERGMEASISQELEISALTSSLVSHNICPNLIKVTALFQSEFGVPAALWSGPSTGTAAGAASEGSHTETDTRSLRPKDFQRGSFQFICMEFCSGGDLESLLRRRAAEADAMCVSEMRSALFQMCFALYACRDRLALRHFDIKLLNFFATGADALLPAGLRYAMRLDRPHAQQPCSEICTGDVGDLDRVYLQVGFGSHIYELPLLVREGAAQLVKLADYGTSAVGFHGIGEPITVQQFTTLENTPPEFLLLGSRARQSFSADTFPLGLSVLHLLIGLLPYEELMEEVECPRYVMARLHDLWAEEASEDPSDMYSVIRQVLDSLQDADETEADVSVLANTLYRYAVLLGVSPALLGSAQGYKAGASAGQGCDRASTHPLYGNCPAWTVLVEGLGLNIPLLAEVPAGLSEAEISSRIEHMPDAELLHALARFEQRSGAPGASMPFCSWQSAGSSVVQSQQSDRADSIRQFYEQSARWNIRTGSESCMQRMRQALSGLGQDAAELLESMLNFDPAKRRTMLETLHSPVFACMRGTTRDGGEAKGVARYMHYLRGGEAGTEGEQLRNV